MTYAQEKKSNSIDAQQSSQTGGATVASSNAGAKDAQMTQGFSLESGAIANTLEKGESAKPGCNPYGTFNYYRSNGALAIPMAINREPYKVACLLWANIKSSPTRSGQRKLQRE